MRAAGPGRVARDALRVPKGLAFTVNDGRAETLASLEGGAPVAARRELPDWTSIFTAAVPLRAALLKQIAREAGVHIYCDDPDIALFANRHFVTLCNDRRAGMVSVQLPTPAPVADAVTGETVSPGGPVFTLPMREKEVRILRLAGG